MSKRTRPRRDVVVEPTPSPPAVQAGPDTLRRVLLVLLTVLLVARPMVGGEFPGLGSAFADPGGLTLTFLALLGCAGWGVWRWWSGQTAVQAGLADLLLLALVVLQFAGASVAAHGRPAWIAAWDWLGVGLIFFLVRQLATRPEDRHGLTAVVLAVAVALAGEGAYQTLFTLPRENAAAREAGQDAATRVREQLSERGLSASPRELEQLTRRLEARQAHGPYFHPGSLAALLALAIPGLVGATVASRRGGGPAWQSGLLAACALLTIVTPGLTGDLLALTAAAVTALLLSGVLFWPARRGGWRVGLPLAVLLAGALVAFGLPASAWQTHREVWPAAWQMVQGHFWRGVGPATFALFYPRYMAETAGARVAEPSSAILGLWANGGVLAVAALVGLVLVTAAAVVRWWRAAPAGEDPAPTDSGSLRWEYYAGGMVGLVLAFILRAGAMPVDDIVGEAIAAGVRSVLWFAAFGLLEGVVWSAATAVASLAGGLSAFVLLMLVHAGIDYPSVSGPALALTAILLTTVLPATRSQGRAVDLLVVPVTLAAACAFFLFVFYPAANSDNVLRRVQMASQHFLVEMARPTEERGVRDPMGYVRARLIEPLARAQREDPENVRLLVGLAAWHGQVWALAPEADGQPGPADRAVAWAVLAQKANPEGPDGYLAELDLRLRVATVLRQAIRQIEQEKPRPGQPATTPEQRQALTERLRRGIREQYQLAAEVLGRYLPRDPTDPTLRYQYAAVLREAGRLREARQEAAEARRLDARVAPPRNLSDPQRAQLDRWQADDSRP